MTQTPITEADMLNDKGLSYHEEHGLLVLRILTYRGTEYCGHADQYNDQLFLAINMIEHTRTKVKSSQTNGSLRASPQDYIARGLSGYML